MNVGGTRLGSLAKAEKGQNREHDDYEPDYVDDVVHRGDSVWILAKPS
jgi:hypothetical protein